MSYGESNGFAKPLKDVFDAVGLDNIEIGCVRIEPRANGLSVIYEYDLRCGGLPARYSRPGAGLKEHFVLRPGEWGRVSYNGRFTGEEWWYEKTVINVGICSKMLPGVFVSTQPACRVAQMAALR